jgi:hypothetical protein
LMVFILRPDAKSAFAILTGNTIPKTENGSDA